MAAKRHNPFKLKDFRGVNAEFITTLASWHIKDTEQMLTAGHTLGLRTMLAQETGIPENVILELVQLSDLARLPGVKGIRARLYHEAGVDSVEKMASWKPEALRKMITEYVERTGFDGIPPLPKEVMSTIENARKLPKVVEY
jgi:hypothetical protein